MKTVLIFAHECAPYNRPESTIGAQRPAQFAKHLPQFGWRAIVVCCDTARRGWTNTRAALCTARNEARAALAAQKDDDSIIIPTPSLAADGALDQLWRVARGENQSPNGTANQAEAATHRAPKLTARWRTQARKALTMLKFTTGDWSQNWQPCARVAAEIIADTTRIDACLAEHSPDAGLFLARWYARRFNVAWAADFRDPVLRPLTDWGRRVYRPVVRRLLQTARATINVTPAWATQDAQLFGLPAYAIPNGFDAEEFALSRTETGATDDPTNAAVEAHDDCLTVAYGGSLFGGLETFFAGVNELRQLPDGDALLRRLRFIYSGLARAAVERAAAEKGVGEIVYAVDQLPRVVSLQRWQTADVMLLLARPPEAQTSATGQYTHNVYPGKIFEYFGLRKPILCVSGESRSLTDKLISDTRTGMSVRTPHEVAAQLAALIKLKINRQPLPYLPDEAEVARYTRSAGAGKLAALLNEISRRPHSTKARQQSSQ